MTTFMRFNLSLTQKSLILVSVPLAFELGFVIELQNLLHEVERENAREVHARAVSSHLTAFLALMMGNSLTGVMNSLSRTTLGYEDTVARAKQSENIIAIREEAKIIQELVRGYPKEEKTFEQLDELQQEIIAAWDDARDALNKQDKVQTLRMLMRARDVQNRLLGGLSAFVEEQQAVEKSGVISQARNRERLETFLVVGVALNILLAVGLTLYFNRGTVRRLKVLMDNTVRLAADKPLNPPLSGDDELAHLDRTFALMAKALALANRQDRAIVDKAMDVICSMDERGSLTRVSPSAEKLWGYQPVDLIGRKYLTLIAPEDQAATLAGFDAIRNGKSDAPVESRVVCQSGELVDMLWSASWSEEDKTMFCVAHDITARKQAENILRAAEANVRLIVESLPVGLLIIDPQGLIEFANPSCRTLCGFTGNEPAGKHIAALFGQANQKKFLADLIAETEKHSWQQNLVRADKSTVSVEVSTTKFLGTMGERCLVMLVDMTERNEIERMRQEFLSMVSHDLRSPLTSVQGCLELLATGICGTLNEKGQKKLAAADRNIGHLIQMITDLLDVERAKSGRLLIFPGEVELHILIEQSLDAVRMQAEDVGISLISQVPEMLIVADGERLSQVLINLLSNAIKFSPPGSTVTISSRTLAEWLEVRVTDQGRGINRAYHNKIFDRFQQVSASDAGYKGGTGLGLAICKVIIDQHGGTIGVDSEEGRGSSFWFRIPMRVAPNS
ncbi:MAG: PAS domain S-box protein [Cyanobacteria bacterium SZAS LIN-3]|nr:PAS domain S-box protein [Cyanobacteria bacterium SZAS LIN-3]